MNTFKNYLNWCKKHNLKSSNALVLNTYFALSDLSSNDDITNDCNDNDLSICDDSVVTLLKKDFPIVESL